MYWTTDMAHNLRSMAIFAKINGPHHWGNHFSAKYRKKSRDFRSKGAEIESTRFLCICATTRAMRVQ